MATTSGLRDLVQDGGVVDQLSILEEDEDRVAMSTGTSKRLGHRRAQLGIAKRATDREQTADDPEKEDVARVAEVGRLETGGGEDAGADDVCQDQ